MKKPDITHIMFDYGGVLADEGFAAGLAEIARRNGLDEKEFFKAAERIIYECGFVTGRCGEDEYWRRVRQETGISGSDAELTGTILERFRLRPRMMEFVRGLRTSGITPVILSDQTDWLDRLEARDRFFHHFGRVFNSFHTGISKRDPECFVRALAELGAQAENTVFADDNPGHCERAARLGIQAHLFTTVDDFLAASHAWLPPQPSPDRDP